MYVIVAWRHRSRVEQNGSNDYSAAGEVAGCARRWVIKGSNLTVRAAVWGNETTARASPYGQPRQEPVTSVSVAAQTIQQESTA
jgi:hypothetical protein